MTPALPEHTFIGGRETIYAYITAGIKNPEHTFIGGRETIYAHITAGIKNSEKTEYSWDRGQMMGEWYYVSQETAFE